jgi:hypothetical protein
MTQTSLTIERLRLRATGLDEGAARKLATLVAEGLVPSLQLPPGRTAIDSLNVEVQARAGEGPELLSRRIVDAIGHALGPSFSTSFGAEEVAL